MENKTLLAIFTIGGIIMGWLLKWALPSAKKVADGEVSRAEAEYQEALADEIAARKTPGTDDDAAAELRARAAKNTRDKKQRLKEILDGLPTS